MSEQQPAEPASPSDPPAGALPPHPGPVPPQYAGQAPARWPGAPYPGAGPYPAHPQGPTFAAPYAAPPRAPYVAPPSAGGSALGIIALIVGLAALIIAPTIAAFAGYSVGVGLGDELALRQFSSDIDIRILAPVRDAVLWCEIAFWAGTVLGIWAVVQGIVAIVKRRGRGPGIAAVVAAALGPIAFLIVLYGFVWTGIAASGSVGW